MVPSLLSAISGLQNFQQQMDVIGNNIANVNTTGFKSARVDYADSFSQTLQDSSAATAGTSGTSAMQVGTGVTSAAIRNLYTQGAIATTGLGTDLAIEGEGYFVVRDIISNEIFVTRAGDFRVDSNGYLVTNTGHRVQGDNIDSTTTPPTPTYGDLQINLTGVPTTAAITSFSINNTGEIWLSLSDATNVRRGQILLQNFTDPQGLVKNGNNLYSGIGAAGPLGGPTAPNAALPGTSGLGYIKSGKLELSNVDLAQEFSTMITAQRAFQATARVITTSDEMLQELVNLKR